MPYADGVPLTLDSFIKEYGTRRDSAFDVLRHHPTLLFVGAGIGADIYPHWRDLLGKLLEKTQLVLTAEQQRLLTSPQIAQLIKEHNKEGYESVIRSHFETYQPLTERVINQLVELPVAGIITTNYDDALDEALAQKGFSSVPLPEIHSHLLNNGKKHIFHIHGLIKNSTGEGSDLAIILSEDEYRHYYVDHAIVKDFLQTALRQFNIIFIGFSLTDPYVMDVVREVKHLEGPHKNGPPAQQFVRRYAFLDVEISEESSRKFLDWQYLETKENNLKDYGITPLWFEKGAKYKGLQDVLKEWAQNLRNDTEGVAERMPVAP